MNKKDLLQLEKLASLTPKEIEKQQPAVFSKLSNRASDNLKISIENKLKNSPKSVKDSLAKIDFAPDKLGNQDVKTILSETASKDRLPAEKKKKLENLFQKQYGIENYVIKEEWTETQQLSHQTICFHFFITPVSKYP